MHREQWRHLFDTDGASDLIFDSDDMTIEKLMKRWSFTTYYIEKHMSRVSDQIKFVDPRYGPVIEVVLDFLFDTGIINDAVIVKLNDDGMPVFDLTNDHADDVAALNSAVRWALREVRANKASYAKRYPHK